MSLFKKVFQPVTYSFFKYLNEFLNLLPISRQGYIINFLPVASPFCFF